MTRIEVSIPGRPWTTNVALRWHPMKRHRQTQDLKADVGWCYFETVPMSDRRKLTGCHVTTQAFVAPPVADPDGYAAYSQDDLTILATLVPLSQRWRIGYDVLLGLAEQIRAGVEVATVEVAPGASLAVQVQRLAVPS